MKKKSKKKKARERWAYENTYFNCHCIEGLCKKTTCQGFKNTPLDVFQTRTFEDGLKTFEDEEREAQQIKYSVFFPFNPVSKPPMFRTKERDMQPFIDRLNMARRG